MNGDGATTHLLLLFLAVAVRGLFVPATWVESNVTLSGEISIMKGK